MPIVSLAWVGVLATAVYVLVRLVRDGGPSDMPHEGPPAWWRNLPGDPPEGGAP